MLRVKDLNLYTQYKEITYKKKSQMNEFYDGLSFIIKDISYTKILLVFYFGFHVHVKR